MKTWAALAAALLVAVSLSTVGYVTWTRPTYIGTLTEATAARWQTAPEKFAVGAFVQDGQELELVSGTAVVTLSSGAKLYMEGPTKLRVDSPKDIQLEHGKIAAKVPIPAIGFTVHSSLAEFIDLGTEFTLQLDAEKTFQLHVFEGLVEVRLDKRFGAAAQRPAQIAEVFAVEFDVNSGDIDKFPFEEGKKMPF
jgi:ferric-dicitrate binding protein FerR (iron transport regulator)